MAARQETKLRATTDSARWHGAAHRAFAGGLAPRPHAWTSLYYRINNILLILYEVKYYIPKQKHTRKLFQATEIPGLTSADAELRAEGAQPVRVVQPAAQAFMMARTLHVNTVDI